jgi:hypothetical protein
VDQPHPRIIPRVITRKLFQSATSPNTIQ